MKEYIQKLEKAIRKLTDYIFFQVSNMRKICIDDMNESSVAAVRGHYEESLAQIGRTVTTPLPVFCVASKLYLQYTCTSTGESCKRESGFLDIADTGIPSVKKWIVVRTLANRETCARNFLLETETFLDSNAAWINDKYSEVKMSSTIRDKWQSDMAAAVENLTVVCCTLFQYIFGTVLTASKKFMTLAASSHENFKRLVHEDLYADFPRAERAAAKATMKKPETWSGILWSTHRAINVRHGTFKSSKGIQYNWNEDMYVCCYKCEKSRLTLESTEDLAGQKLKTKWDQTLSIGFTAEQASYISKARALIVEFANLAADSTPCPDVAVSLSVLKDLILRNQAIVETETDKALKEIFEASKDAHRTMTPTIKKFLAPMYDECGADKGRGVKARNIARHKEQLEEKGDEIHHAATKALKRALNKMLASIPGCLEAGRIAALQDIRDKVSQFFEENSAAGLRTSGRKLVSPAKIALAKELMVVIDELEKKWTVDNGPIEVEEENNEEDAALFNNNKLFDITGKDPNATYEDIDELQL